MDSELAYTPASCVFGRLAREAFGSSRALSIPIMISMLLVLQAHTGSLEVLLVADSCIAPALTRILGLLTASVLGRQCPEEFAATCCNPPIHALQCHR